MCVKSLTLRFTIKQFKAALPSWSAVVLPVEYTHKKTDMYDYYMATVIYG